MSEIFGESEGLGSWRHRWEVKKIIYLNRASSAFFQLIFIFSLFFFCVITRRGTGKGKDGDYASIFEENIIFFDIST
jgi:hypothetical protein